MQTQIVINQWETDFFQRPIAKLEFVPQTDTQPTAHLIQVKLAAGELDKIAYVQQQGFQLVEGEVDFCLDLQKNAPFPPAVASVETATESDISALRTLFGNAFPTSRFRSPWFSPAENQRFYQTWIEKAVKGEFDHLCLQLKNKAGEIQGAISLRLSGKQVRVGLLAVAPQFQGRGVAKTLLFAAINWALAQQAEQFWVATQISNLAAIRLYQSIGAQIAATNYWFYK